MRRSEGPPIGITRKGEVSRGAGARWGRLGALLVAREPAARALAAVGTPEDEVIAALTALEASFDGGNAAAVLALFTTEPDVTLWGSAETEHAVGQAELGAVAEAIASAAGSFAIDRHERRDSLEGDVAWINAAGLARSEPEDGGVRELPYRLTGVLLRREGVWKWHTFHGSEAQIA